MLRKPVFERVQDAVYHLEEGVGAVAVKAAVALLLLGGIMVVYVATQFYGFTDPAAMETAQLARNLARSGRFETSVIRPADFWHLKRELEVRLPFAEFDRDGDGAVTAADGAPPAFLARFDRDADGLVGAEEIGLEHGRVRPTNGDFRYLVRDGAGYALRLPGTADPELVAERNLLRRFPDLRHAPGWPALLALAFRLGGVSFESGVQSHPAEMWVLAVGLLCTLLTGVLVFWLGLQLFNPRTALLATLFFYAGDVVWRGAISGLEGPLLMLLAASASAGAVCWSRAAEEGRGRAARLLAALLVLAGLAGLLLTRYAAWVALPGLFIFLGASLPRRGWLAAALVVVAALAALAPWLSRNQKVTGSWFGTAAYTILEGTASFPERRFERANQPDFVPKLAEYEVRRKALLALEKRASTVLVGVGGSLFCSALFLVSFLFGFGSARVNALRWGALVSILLWLPLVGAYGEAGERLGAVFVPVAVCLAAGLFDLGLARLQLEMRLTNQLVMAAGVAVAALPLLIALLPPQPRRTDWTTHPGNTAMLAGMFDADEWLVSDVPEAMAWYGDRPTLMLPATLDDFVRVNDHIQYVHGLLFTRVTLDRPYMADFGPGAPEESWAKMVYSQKVSVDFPLQAEWKPRLGQLLYFDRIERSERLPKR